MKQTLTTSIVLQKLGRDARRQLFDALSKEFVHFPKSGPYDIFIVSFQSRLQDYQYNNVMEACLELDNLCKVYRSPLYLLAHSRKGDVKSGPASRYERPFAFCNTCVIEDAVSAAQRLKPEMGEPNADWLMFIPPRNIEDPDTLTWESILSTDIPLRTIQTYCHTVTETLMIEPLKMAYTELVRKCPQCGRELRVFRCSLHYFF